jgi:hypothetical protein
MLCAEQASAALIISIERITLVATHRLVEHAQVKASTAGGVAGGPAAIRQRLVAAQRPCHVLLEGMAAGALPELPQQRVAWRKQPVAPVRGDTRVSLC